jgi:DNA-binding NtrC family response regulator
MGNAKPSLLIVEDDARLADQLRWALDGEYRVHLADSRPAALARLSEIEPDLILLDLCLPPENIPEEGFRVLEAARDCHIQAVVMSAIEEREPALRAIERGAYDFFVKPVDFGALRIVITRALERTALERENRLLRQQLRGGDRPSGIVGTSEAIRGVFESIRRVADSPLTVAILGESGTGKSLVARAIHDVGQRSAGPFVPVHCAALPETLLEAELFGHEKGAFTGAAHTRVGRFEAASGGSLFLDEIGCLDHAMQVKLLRVLEEHSIERLGSNQGRPVDARLIIATNENLEDKVRNGDLREDFYYRIMVFPILVPPLRERIEDIPLLADHFLQKLGDEQGRPPKRLSEGARLELISRDWPGNVRELRNAIETAALVVDGDTIDANHLDHSLRRPSSFGCGPETNGLGFKAAVESYERAILVKAIRAADGVKARAARALKLEPSQMKYLVRKHHL